MAHFPPPIGWFHFSAVDFLAFAVKLLFSDDVVRARASVRPTSDAAFSATQWKGSLFGLLSPQHVSRMLNADTTGVMRRKGICLFARPAAVAIQFTTKWFLEAIYESSSTGSKNTA